MTRTTDCPDCGVDFQLSNSGAVMCPHCESWAFRDAVSDGVIYSAVSATGDRGQARAYVEAVRVGRRKPGHFVSGSRT
jgi:uncharacterized Zn finger protein (UPF0148 family)